MASTHQVNPVQTVGELLQALADLQADTAPITLSIGAISDTRQVMHDCVVITDAPPAALRLIQRLCDSVNVSIKKGGVMVSFPKGGAA